MRILDSCQDPHDEPIGSSLEDQKRREREAELFALATPPPEPQPTLPKTTAGGSDTLTSNGGAAAGWHPGADSLTVWQQAAAQAVQAGSDVSSAGGRVTIRVDGGEFGPIDIVAERLAEGINLTVIVGNDAALACAEVERVALVHALMSSGIRVASLTIRLAGAGTVLAQPALATRFHGGRPLDEGEAQGGTSGGRRQRRLNTIG